jgi:hypothetical protein
MFQNQTAPASQFLDFPIRRANFIENTEIVGRDASQYADDDDKIADADMGIDRHNFAIAVLMPV